MFGENVKHFLPLRSSNTLDSTARKQLKYKHTMDSGIAEK